LEPLLEQTDDVLIVERIEDHSSSTARAHQAHAAEQAKLMRHRRFGQSKQPRDVADAQLRARQRVEDADARHVAEHFEGLSERDDGTLTQQRRLEPRDFGGIEMENVAAIEIYGILAVRGVRGVLEVRGRFCYHRWPVS